MIEPYRHLAAERLKKINGQINGILKMIEEGQYCPEILTQVLALQGALKGVAPLILESHLHTCGKEHLGSKDSKKRNKFIKELVKACELSIR